MVVESDFCHATYQSNLTEQIIIAFLGLSTHKFYFKQDDSKFEAFISVFKLQFPPLKVLRYFNCIT